VNGAAELVLRSTDEMMATSVEGTVHHHEMSPARDDSIIHTAPATAAAMMR
jgi:hypothetical protein